MINLILWTLSSAIVIVSPESWARKPSQKLPPLFEVREERLNYVIPATSARVDFRIGPSEHETSNSLEVTWKCGEKTPIKKMIRVCNADLDQLKFENEHNQILLTVHIYKDINFNLRDEQTFLEGKKPKSERGDVPLTCYEDLTPFTLKFPKCD